MNEVLGALRRVDRVPESGMPSAVSTAAHTFGQVLRAHHWDGLSLEEVVMPRALSVPEHRHEGAQLYFLLEGEYLEALGAREHVLAPGSAWFRDPGVCHRNAVVGEDPSLILIITAEPRRLDFLRQRHRPTGPVSSLLVEDAKAEVLRELRREDEVSRFALEGWSLLLLSHVERAAAGQHQALAGWLGDALTFIERRYADPITPAAVAAAIGVQPTTLATAFRRSLHGSVGEQIRKVRLRHARHALLATNVPIKQIAADCGFFDQAHLGRWCKRAFGMSPAELRHTTRLAKKARRGRAADRPGAE